MSTTTYATGSRLPVRTVRANNFATESENRMHSDEVAAEFGFRGGLVPGVGVFAYMTQPIVEALGRDWLERGRITARFIKPVYHGERARVHTEVTSGSPLRFGLEVRNADGVTCAVGEAEIPDQPPAPPDATAFPLRPMPAPAERLAASVDAFTPGETIIGSLQCKAAWHEPVEGPDPFVEAVCDPLPIYGGDDAACHPALIVSLANRLLKDNVDLGPWIHTASAVQYFALPKEGAPLTLRGNVASAFEKRGHHFVELELVLFDASDRPLAHVVHTSIVRPARAKA